jgi:hypothetical protein
MSLILIGAHPKKINKGELIRKHFWGNEIQVLIEREKLNKENKEIKIETIDILPGGTYQSNIFDEIFVKQHQEIYDQIYLLDCGGIWYVLQTLETLQIMNSKESIETIESKEIIKMREELTKLSYMEIQTRIQELIEKLYSMLKINGLCVFSKFTDLLFQETFISLLNDLGFLYEIETYDFVGTVIIIRKI